MELPILYQIKPRIQATVCNNGRLSSPQTQQHCVSLQCFLVCKRLALQALEFGNWKKKRADLQHFNDMAQSKREINDTVYG